MSYPINPKVVDLSHYNSINSFDNIKADGIVGIIHKATQGAGLVDNKYAARKEAALAAGLLWGAYHFATDADPIAQVNNFLTAAQPDAYTLVALDWEQNGNNSMDIDQAKAWLAEIEQRLSRKAIIYSGSYAKDQLGSDVDEYMGSHRLWHSQYGSTPRIQASWDSFWLWQYTGDGLGPEPHIINGVSGNNVDISTYDGTDDQLKAEWAS
jgi:GH25 family lysozyme M1 (1,4-beta-N-acetylmuramidase)